tara:strand:+ start:35 stop:319 length:285 start_codon:yes stop_codon:yes gene_type:complete
MLEQFRARMAKEMKESGYTPEPKFTPTFKLTQLTDLEVDGVDMADYPDFCDAFITSGCVTTWDDECRDLTEDELDYINDECPEVAQELAHESIQ